MHLRSKLSLLLASTSVSAVIATTYALSIFFASDQEAYIKDLQGTLALFAEKQLTTRMEMLHLRMEDALREGRGVGRGTPMPPGVVGGAVWKKQVPIAASAQAHAASPPAEGTSRWALSAAPAELADHCIRWIGRYGKITVTLELDREWVRDVLNSSHGTTTELVIEDGSILLRASDRQAPISGVEYFRSRDALEKIRSGPPELPVTRFYSSPEGVSHLGTFLVLSTEPSLVVAVSTPAHRITTVLRRIYRQAALIVLVFLALALGIGVFFSASLTRPLRSLTLTTLEIGRGELNSRRRISGVERNDEVGILARSFTNMSQELEKTRDELRRKERLAAMGKFSAAIAHQIKNPLTGILGMAQLASLKITKAASGPPPIQFTLEALENIKGETLRANRIVTNLMKSARQEKPPELVIDLREKVGRSMEILRPAIEQSGIELIIHLPVEPVICIGDGDQLQEVLGNLTENGTYALKHRETKRLTVSLRVADGLAYLSIADTGEGMSSEVIEHLFEPFYTTKPIGEGTGLGLSVCHGIIANHRGEIRVQSEFGVGTCFTVVLPIASTQSATPEPRAA